MNFLETQEFSIVQPVGVKVIAFYIVYSDLEKGTPICRLEKIEYVDKVVDGKTERIFTVLENKDKELDIIVMSLTKHRCDIAYAKLQNDKLEYTDKIVGAKYNDSINFEQEEQEYRFRYNPIKQMVIIDADTGEQMIPVIERGANELDRMGKYILLKGRRYIIMRLRVKPI